MPGGRIWKVSLAVAALLTVGGSVTPSARAGASADQACSVAPSVPTVWASYELDQSFTPASSSIAAWEVKLLLLGQFDGPVRSRLVFNPAGDNAVGSPPTTFATSGIVLGEVTNQIKGGRFRSFWERFELASPVDLPASPLTGSYSIQLETPLDPDFQPYGARLGWWTCGGDYNRGAAYHSLSPTGIGQFSGDAFGVKVSFNDEPGTNQPIVRQKHHIGDFQFRTFPG